MTELVGKTSDRLTAGWALVGSVLFPVQAGLAVELCTALDLLWVSGNTMAYQAGEFAWWCVLESTVISTGIGGHQNLPCKREVVTAVATVPRITRFLIKRSPRIKEVARES